MRAKMWPVLMFMAVAAAYYVSGRQRSAYPPDFRDAVGSGSALDSIPNASSGSEFSVPTPAAAAYSRPPGSYSDYCGADISVPLAALLGKIVKAYNSWTPELKKRNCAVMDVDAKLNAIDGWDIEDLRPNLGYPSVISKEILKKGECTRTLTVGGNCYRDEEINYVMWGEMAKLCGKSLGWSNFKIRAYLAYYYTLYPPHRKEKDDSSYPNEAGNKVAWSKAGYNGWPNAAAPAATRPECGPSRSLPYDTSISFTSHWANTEIK